MTGSAATASAAEKDRQLREDIRLLGRILGDTLRATSEVIGLKESKSRPNAGIVTFLHRCINQRGEIVCQCERAALIKGKAA